MNQKVTITLLVAQVEVEVVVELVVDTTDAANDSLPEPGNELD
jgi:hypothetical protein